MTVLYLTLLIAGTTFLRIAAGLEDPAAADALR